MLVLSRKESQTILIGEDIVLTVLRIQGNTVRIGIQAPGNLRVLRGELVADARPHAADDCGQNDRGRKNLRQAVGEAA
jgi:carbon storage regulator